MKPVVENLSSTINRLSESATLAMARKARELKAQGINVISLSLGEPDFNVPEFVKDAAIEAINNNLSHYTPVNGYLELREAISNKFKRDNNLNYSTDQIVVSNGAKQSIAISVMSLVSEGDEVLLPAPYWVSYYEIVKLAGGIPVPIETNIKNDFKISPEELSAAITPKTRMMIFSSPCNPSGSVYSKDELQKLSEVLVEHENLITISDEIYELIIFKGKNYSLASFPNMSERVITINGVSKGFAMTGYRLGYLGAPLWIAKACIKMQGQITSAPSSIAQWAAKKAVETNPSEVAFMKEAFFKRRDLMLGLLNDIPGVNTNIPEGAFYIFPNVTAFFGKSFGDLLIKNADDLCEYILQEAQVALVTGSAFGSPNCIRISYASSEDDLREAAKRMKNALLKLH